MMSIFAVALCVIGGFRESVSFEYMFDKGLGSRDAGKYQSSYEITQ